MIILCTYFVFVHRFISKNNGVLFENDLLQIGVKSEFRQNLGRIILFYGNKTTFPFMAFVSDTHCTDQLANQINLQMKPVDTTIEGGAQKQQMINIECVSDFEGVPDLILQYM